MAKDISIIPGIYSDVLARKVAEKIGAKVLTVERQHYRNGCRFGRVVESMRGNNVYIFQSQLLPEADVCVMEAARLINLAHQSSAAMITLICPSFPYAQSDKKDQAHIPITLSIVATLFEALCANIPFKIAWVDGHSYAITTAFRSGVTDPLSARYMFADYIRKNIGTHDLGAVAADTNLNRMYQLANELRLKSHYFFDKRRIDNSGKSSTGAINAPIKEKRALLIDDLVVTGGSTMEAIKAIIRENVEEIWVVISHSYHTQEFIDFVEQTPQVKGFITTDSVILEDDVFFPKRTVLGLSELFYRYISCIQESTEVSPLYKDKVK